VEKGGGLEEKGRGFRRVDITRSAQALSSGNNVPEFVKGKAPNDAWKRPLRTRNKVRREQLRFLLCIPTCGSARDQVQEFHLRKEYPSYLSEKSIPNFLETIPIAAKANSVLQGRGAGVEAN